MIPQTWEPFLEIRKQGYRPEVPVVVSLVGEVKTSWPCLVVPKRMDNVDFRLLFNLDVIITHVGKSSAQLVSLADELVRIGVRNLETWDVARNEWVSVVFEGEKFLKPVPPMEVA